MGHGHVIANPDGSLARCGGPAICQQCSIEYAEFHGKPFLPGFGGYEPTAAVKDQIEKSFTYHAPKADQPARYERIRQQAKALAYTLVGSCPHSRELSIALTKLEEVAFFANAAIARGE